MNGMWIYLKENVKCGTRLCDVISIPERFNNCNKKSFGSDETIFDRKTVHPISTPIRELIFRQHHNQTWLYELEKENPSRRIVEMIFQRAWTNTNMNSPEKRTIKSVMKVRNSAQRLERFEMYRETVKTLVGHHPRDAVDGNEVLRFYGTMISCRARRSRGRASALCKEYSCGVCKILRSNFGAMAVTLSSCSGEDSSDCVAARKISCERAVIVCRIIAGNSAASKESSCSGNTTVCNPNAVLPCFVIVFN